MRIYDAGLGWFLRVDTFQAKFAGETPYAFVGNRPLLFVDSDGRDRIAVRYSVDATTGKITGMANVTEFCGLKSQIIRLQNLVDKHDTQNEYEWYDPPRIVYGYFDENGEI